MPITRPIADLPLILCGPILRRVEAESVSVFVALKHRRVVTLTVHLGDTPGAPVKLHGQAETVALGRFLHVLTVTVQPEGMETPLEPGQLYGYDLTFTKLADPDPQDGGPDSASLADLDLLAGEMPLGYQAGLLPTFALPPVKLDRLNLLHGSCRKPHGEGRDMLAELDEIIAADRADPMSRPHLLLLTGDQIYADDVSLALLRTLHDTASQLLGWRERFTTVELMTDQLEAVLSALRVTVDHLLPNDGPLPDLQEVLQKLDAGTLTQAELDDGLGTLAQLQELLDQLLADLPNPQPSLYQPERIAQRVSQVFGLLAIRLRISTPLLGKGVLDKLQAILEDLPRSLATSTADDLDDLKTGLTKAKTLVEGLIPFFENVSAVLAEMVSDGSWGHIDETPTDDAWNYALSRIAPPQRSAELKQFAQLTSEEMDAHLMFLGEFYLMYCFVWSDALWPRLEGSAAALSLATAEEAVPNYGILGKLRLEEIEKQRSDTLDFARTLPQVRRALANLPTLMIFDDHEVTDDWNLHHDWVMLVNQSPAGSQLLRNGLAAYAVFQDWGNQPWDYKPGAPGAAILDGLKVTVTIDGEGRVPAPQIVDPQDGSDSGVLNEVLSIGVHALDYAQRLSDGRKDWDYTYPFLPTSRDQLPYQIFVLDTRTHRRFPGGDWLDDMASHLKALLGDDLNPSAGLVGPAALLSDEALVLQMPWLSQDHLNIVVSPAPAFGVPLVEDVFQRLLVAKDSPDIADNEAWQSNPQAFQRFLDVLKDYDVVLLSGDVHYAFSNDVRLRAQAGAPPAHRLVQLCASSLKNETDMTQMIGKVGHAATLSELWATFANRDKLQEFYALKQDNLQDFQDRGLELLGDGFWGENLFSTTRKTGDQNGEVVDRGEFDKWFTETSSLGDLVAHFFRFKDISLFSLPNLIPTGLQIAGTGISSAWEFFGSAAGGGAFVEEAFRVFFLRDDRPEAVECPDIVGYNNLGQIAFETDPDGKLDRLTHILHWYPHVQGKPTGNRRQTCHRTEPRWAYFKREIAALAQQELRRWRTWTGQPIKELRPDGSRDPRAEALLGLYYRVAGLGEPVWIDGTNVVWSAAFISYLVSQAGGAAEFHRSSAHIRYIREAFTHRADDDRANPFWLQRVSEHAPQVGDILCKDRANAQAGEMAVTYDNLFEIDPVIRDAVDEHGNPRYPSDFRKTHCDVVVWVNREGGKLVTIGGNLSQTVGREEVNIDAEGKITDPGYFAVIKVRSDLDAA